MKNVIVFAVESEHYAIELRWVREIFTLGPVTPVPGAPAHVIGAINMRGAITPVLDLSALGRTPARATPASPAPGGPRVSARAGDGAALIDVEGVTAALRMAKVDEISTASRTATEREALAQDGGDPLRSVIAAAVVDSQGREVGLIDPPALMDLTLSMARGGEA